MRFWLLALLALPAFSQSLRKLDGSTISIAEAEAFARKTLADKKVTGAQIAVLNNGRLVWSFAYGNRQLNPDLPMTPDTNIWAASITKGTFGVYVQKLVEKENFPLDTPIYKLLPNSLETYPNYKETATDIVKDPRWPRVTPRMLLNHTSSLINFAFLEPTKKMQLHSEPGTVYRYSGEGFNLLQFVIEQQKGRPLDQLMEDALFKPLGMTQTGMIYRKDFDPNVADRFNEQGEFISKTRRFPARAGGNMSTSVNDLAKLATALLSGKLVKTKELLKPTIRIVSAKQFDPVQPTTPAFPNIAYSMGWGLLTKTTFGPAFFKEGHGDGAQNFMICFTKSKSCMILLSNSDNGERAFRPLLENILGNTVTPWAWHSYP
jgi:CubicO group peptidase (beta-lactamase class C family)